MLHVVCGTFVFDLLENIVDPANDILLLLQVIREHITKKPTKGRQEPLPKAALQLGRALKLNLEKNYHEDACDFYDHLMQHLSDGIIRPSEDHYLQAQFLNLRTCQTCMTHEGETVEQNYITVKVLKSQEKLSLSSLLWEKCTGQYATTAESMSCQICVGNGNSSPGYHELTFLKKCPIIFPVLLNRAEQDMATLCTSPVEIPVTLELSDLSVHFEKKEMCHYDLLAIIYYSPSQRFHGRKNEEEKEREPLPDATPWHF